MQTADFEIRQRIEYCVLIVEDKAADYQLLNRALKRSTLSCKLSRAATAEEALSLIQKHSFDVVLLDYALPDMTGLELFKQMVSDGIDLPVIFVTAMGNEQAAVEAFKFGAQDYLIKDISGEYLNLLPFVIHKAYKQWEDSRERQRTEQELRKLNTNLEKKVDERTREIKAREALTGAILRSLKSHIAVLDRHGKIISVNTAWVQFARENGDPDGRLTGRNCDYIEVTKKAAEAGDEYARKALAGLTDVLEGKRTFFTMDYPCHAPDRKRWFNLNVTPLTNGFGGVVTAHSDITHQKRILDQEKEQRLWAETLGKITQFLNRSLNIEEVLNNILEQLARVVDFQSANVMLLNGEMLDVVAYKHKAGTLNPLKFIHIQELTHIKQALEEQRPVYIADTSQDPRWHPFPGTEYIRCWVGFPLVVQNRTIGLLNMDHNQPNAYSEKRILMTASFANQVGVAIENARLFNKATREIEERKRAEAALEQERATLAQRVAERTAELTRTNHKLSQAIETKDQFLANMSHELRTPLTAILGKTEVLQDGLYGNLTDKQIEALAIINSSGDHLLSLINDILDVSRIEAGQLELNWEVVALRSLCEASIQYVVEEAHKKHITINRQFDERIQTIQGDSRRLTQIVVNLLSNAVKFTPEGGEIGLEVSGDFSEGIVHIVVWDTGIGISKSGIRNLLGDRNRPKAFVQLENTLAREFPGSGLGLALVYDLTEMHNGSLGIESKPGKGTRMTISLPMTRGNSLTAVEAKSAGSPLKNNHNGSVHRQTGKILLGEDNSFTVDGLLDYLTYLGYEVFVAVDGEQVVRDAVDINPDLIIMDIQLPKRDGLEAIRMIRTDFGLVNIPIIALTALTMPGDRERCLEAGANEYLSKPFNIDQVIDIFRQYGVLEA